MVRYNGAGHRLTRPQKKLIKAIVESKGSMNITEICKTAKVSPKVWYRFVSDPEMATLLPEALDFQIGQQLIPVVQKVVERALEGSAKHAELVFRLSGLLEDGQTKILQVFGKEGEGSFLTEGMIKQMIRTRK